MLENIMNLAHVLEHRSIYIMTTITITITIIIAIAVEVEKVIDLSVRLLPLLATQLPHLLDP